MVALNEQNPIDVLRTAFVKVAKAVFDPIELHIISPRNGNVFDTHFGYAHPKKQAEEIEYGLNMELIDKADMLNDETMRGHKNVQLYFWGEAYESKLFDDIKAGIPEDTNLPSQHAGEPCFIFPGLITFNGDELFPVYRVDEKLMQTIVQAWYDTIKHDFPRLGYEL